MSASHLPATVQDAHVSRPAERDAQSARRFAAHARSANTRRAYRSDWADFCDWCSSRDLAALPATNETVALYVASRAEVGPDDADGRPTAGLKPKTLERRLAAINSAHRLASYGSPASRRDEPLHSVWAGMMRTVDATVAKVAPALPSDLRAMIAALPLDDSGAMTLRSKRDRALLLLGFAGALRRSELAAVEASHVQLSAEGLRLFIPRSKADQEGRGAVLGIRYGEDALTCPVRSLQAWMQALRSKTGEGVRGPLFRKIDRWGNLGGNALQPLAIADVIKRSAARAGLEPALYSGHSLRAGFATQAARAGKHERAIMRHTRHKSERVLREYIREGALFDENPTDGIGL
jgi:site-specific recombinase XerD